MRYEHPLIIYELDGVLADCAVREANAEAAGPRYGKGSSAYREALFDSRRIKQDLLIDKGRDLVKQLWKDNLHRIILTRRPTSATNNFNSPETYYATMTWCLEQGLMPGWFSAWIFRERRVRSSEALWKQEQAYLYIGEHPKVDHLYVVDKSEESRYAIGFLCQDLYLGVDLMPDIQALEAILERDRDMQEKQRMMW